MSKTLIVIDMQKDFIDGTLANPNAEAIVEPIIERIMNWEHPNRIILTRDTHKEDYLITQEGQRLPVEHCLEGTDGWQVDKRIYDFICDPAMEHRDIDFIDKHQFGYYPWADHFNQKPEYIELCGTVASICVVSNAIILKSIFPEATIAVNPNLIADITEEGKQAAIAVMRNCQIETLGN